MGQVFTLTLVYPRELAGQQIPLRLGLTLGRSPDADVAAILHPTISRQHAEIRAGLGGVPCLRDLESRNGSRVNGKLAQSPIPLEVQSVVRLGDVIGVVDEPSSAARFDEDPVLPGVSPRIARAREELSRAAPDAAPLLVIGETGTGKERIASAAHRASGRKGPYLVLNCAELSAQLIESELFGHERGAFTGALAAKKGLFVAADGGTLFLDEIGELPLELQAKLLRVVQEREVRPVGAARALPVDTRVVAATNRDLAQRVEEGAFRRDLYARLALWELRLPALRDRRQDILAWLDRLLQRWCETRGTQAKLNLLPDAAERIVLAAWLDNLRGLDRLVHRLSLHGFERPLGVSALTSALPELRDPAGAAGDDTTVEEVAALPSKAGSRPPSTAPAVERPSREELMRVFEDQRCSVRATAKHFGRERRQIYRWLEAYGIQRNSDEE